MTEQARAALALANEVRMTRQVQRRRVADLPRDEGIQAVADLLEDPPAWLGSAWAVDVAAWPRQCGVSFAQRMIRRAGLATTTRRIRDLTQRERDKLAAVLRFEAL